MVYIIARRDLRSKKKADMGAEAGLLALCVASGVLGLYTESITLMCTLFLGGVGTWMAMGIPAWIEETKANFVAAENAKQSAKAQAEEGANGEGGKPSVPLPSVEATLGLIKKRRTVFPKDYNGGKVPREHIEMLLEAANWAPTHQLTQPWRFVVLEGESKKAFEDLTIKLVGQYTIPSDKAAEAVERVKGKASKAWPLISHYVAICMSRQPNKAGKQPPEWEDQAAVACAVQNMQLLATSLHVATYWSSWQAVARDAPEMSEFLGLDAARGDKCLGVLVLGQTDRFDSYRGSRSPAMDKVTWRS